MMLTPKRALDLVDRQRHAVDRDRALGAMKRRQRRRHLERHADESFSGPRSTMLADAVDMAGDDMAAQLVADRSAAPD
jgi:hypothetical protein